MRAATRAALCAAGVAVGAFVSLPAHADAVQACVAAVGEGQKLERAAQLRAARERFLACDKSECPTEVRTVCDRLLTAVETNLPSIILVAKDTGGKDLLSVRVSVDGAPLASSLDGTSVLVDPGPHTLRFEHEGDAPIEQSVVIREAEKNRAIVVTFAPPRMPVAPPPLPGPRRPIPGLVYAIAGVGVASLGVFVALDVDGQSRYTSCQSGGCSQSTFHAISVERDVTLVTGGVGVAALGVATWLFLTRPTETPATSAFRVDVDTLSGGALMRATGSF